MDYKKTNEYQLDKLKTDFQNIQSIIEEIKLSKTILLEKIDQSKVLYQDLIKKNNTKLFLFCLDSLYFQYKLSLMDYESMENDFRFIVNRMYCDYYKLYNIIVLEMSENGYITLERKPFPQYKDLDILHEYDWTTIIGIHNEILSVIDRLYAKYRENVSGIENYVETKRSIVSISNFLNTLKYENGLLENEIMLYINYMSFFHFSQKKTLVRLYSKMVEFNKHIDEYSNIGNVISIDDINSVSEEKDEETISISESEYNSILKNETNEFVEYPVREILQFPVLEKREEQEKFQEPIVKRDIIPVLEKREEPIVEREMIENPVLEKREEPEKIQEEEKSEEQIIQEVLEEEPQLDLISLSSSDTDEDFHNLEVKTILHEFYQGVFPKELEESEKTEKIE